MKAKIGWTTNRLHSFAGITISLVALFCIPLLGSSYYDFLFSLALIYSMWALGYNFLLGYTGLLSFGHGAFFGLGAYTVAILVTKFSFKPFLPVIGIAVLATAFLGAVIGYLCVRYTEVYFALLTLAFSMFFYALVFKLYYWTGGSDGIGIRPPDLFGLRFSAIEYPAHYYYITLAFFLISVYIGWRIVNSPFGKALQAIRDNPLKAEAIGIPVRRYKWYAFIISTAYSGLAGALYAPLFGHVVPDLFHFLFAGEVLFATLLGGYTIFLGPIVGGIVFTVAKRYITAVTIYWPLVLGALLVAVTLFFPQGIVGTTYSLLRRKIGIKGGE